MKRTLILSALAALALAHPSWAQDMPAVSIIDAQPVEEVPAEEAAPAAEPLPAAIPTPKADQKEPPVEYDTAVLQGLKKVTAEVQTFDAPLDTPVALGALSITVKKCTGAAPGDRPENAALILIHDTKQGSLPATVFSGWMFSSSPAISALEHPVYDITMIECVNRKKAPAPVVEKPAAKPKKK